MSDIVESGSLLSFCLGAHRDALLEATEKLGRAGCALVSLYVYQLLVDAVVSGTPMANPGGRFRAIVREVASGARSLERSIDELDNRKLKHAGVSIAHDRTGLSRLESYVSLPPRPQELMT